MPPVRLEQLKFWSQVMPSSTTKVYTVNIVLSSLSKEDQNWFSMTDYCLMQVKSIAEFSPLEHSAILLTCMYKATIFVLSIFKWPLKTGFTVQTCVKWPLKNRQNKDLNDKW